MNRALPILLGLYLAANGLVRAQPVVSHCETMADAIPRIGPDETIHWDETLARVEKAQRCFGEVHNHSTAQLSVQRARLLTYMQRHNEALEELSHFDRLDRAHAPSETVARALMLRADALDALDQPADALETALAAAPFFAQLEPVEQVRRLMQTGDRLRVVGDFHQAAHYYAGAESLASLHPSNLLLQQARGRALLNRGGIALEKHTIGLERVELAEVSSLIEEALVEFGELQEINPKLESLFERIQGHLWLAQAYRLDGRPGQALEKARDAERLAHAQLHLVPQWKSWTLAEKGLALSALGRFEEARRDLSEAVAYDRKRGDRDFEAASLRDLALVEEAAAEANAEEEVPDYQRAEEALRASIELSEIGRDALGLSTWSISNFELQQQAYRHLVRLLLRSNRPAEALAVLDQTRARHLRDLRIVGELQRTLGQNERSRFDSLTAMLSEARYKLLDPTLEAMARSQVQARIIQAERALKTQIGMRPAPPRPLPIEAIQRLLSYDGRSVVTYFFEAEGSYVFVIQSDTLVAKRLITSASEVARLIEAAGLGRPRSNAEDQSNGPFSLQHRPLAQLYQALLGPIEPLLKPGAPLTIIPEAPVASLPFALLITEPVAGYAANQHSYLVRRHSIAMELAVSLLLETQPAAAPEALDLVVLGKSRFGTQSGPDGNPLTPLPHVIDETRHIARHFSRRKVALDDEATEPAFRRWAGEARVIHMASHAFSNPSYPLNSAIVLSEKEKSDGMLYLHEMQHHALRADLVVLSGCGTARGGRRLGEGMIGLQYGMRAAGAASTLATLWSVEDEAIATLMDHFYNALHKGHPKDQALQEAQLAYLEAHEGVTASPFFWASTVLYGDPSPVNFSRQSRNPQLWILALIAIVSGGMLAFLSKRVLMHRRQRVAGQSVW